MLTVHNLEKSYGLQTILEGVNFSLSSGERVGLIGPNGCGKSTLLRILANIEGADRGKVTYDSPDTRLGYLAQGFEVAPELTVGEVLTVPVTSGVSELARLAAALEANPNDEALRTDYDTMLDRVAWESSLPSPTPILAALGLEDIPVEQPVGLLSGGQKTRLSLARILIKSPNLLLLDEPTNHLDIEMLEWLETWLTAFKGAVLVVSHDRTFLDHTVQRILEIDLLKHTLHAYAGNYSAYLEQKLAEKDRHLQEYSDWREEISRLRRAATHVHSLTVMKKGGKADGGDKFAKDFFGGRATGRVAKRAKVIEDRLEHLSTEGKVEKPRATWQMKAEFGAHGHLGHDAVSVEELRLGYPGMPLLLDGVTAQLEGGQHAVLTGPNGCGKTSLLRAITGDLAPMGGTIRVGANVRIGYMSQEQEQLEGRRSALEMVQAVAPWNQTEARAFLHKFLFTGDDPLRPAQELSYGERARLQLGLLIAQGCNFLILDEPINHLDIPSREAFERGLGQFEGTILAVVHDRYFIERFADVIWLIRDHAIQRIYP